MKHEALKESVWRANLDLHRLGISSFSYGSVSGIDRERQVVVIRSREVHLEKLRMEHMVVVNLSGKIIEGRGIPSEDLSTHLVLYSHFLEIGGIAHTHSSFACVWAQMGLDIPCLGTTQADFFYGAILCTRTLTVEEARQGEAYSTGLVIVEKFNRLDYRQMPGVLVAHHGAFTWGKDPQEAVHHSMVLEEVAKTTYFALLFHPQRLPLPPTLMEAHFFSKEKLSQKGQLSCKEYRTVKITQNRIEAELIRGYLEAEGIRVLLKPSTFPYGGEAYFGDTGPFEVQVLEDDFSEAQRIIADLEKHP
ncbi:MAG: class II aldolase/adducin family protein [Candidatus Caldatribacteriaceae bacterium]